MNNPFVFDCREVLRPGATVSHLVQEGASPVRIGLQMIAIPKGGDVTVSATLTPLGEGIMVDAEVDGTLAVQCGRCLAEFDTHETFVLHEIFADGDSFITGDSDDDGDADEIPQVENGRLDLTQTAIDTVGLELPFSPVCADYGRTCDSAREGSEMPAPDAVEEDTLIDSRWAGLEKFK